MPALISPTNVTRTGLTAAVICGLVLVLSAASGWAVSAAGLAVLVMVVMTLRLAEQATTQLANHRDLETETRFLRQQFERLAAAAAGPVAGESSRPVVNADLPLDRQLSALAAQARALHSSYFDLWNERARLTVVLENLDCGVVVVSPQGEIVLANVAAKKQFPVSQPMVGSPLAETIRHRELLAKVREVAIDRSPREVVVDERDASGRRQVLRILCASVPYEKDVSAVLLVANDESEIREIEETRREFVANVSHELKTPLAAIKGYVETAELAIQDDPEAAKYFVSQIHDQTRRLESLVSDMLTLARAQAGTQNLRLTAVDLHAVVAESIATYTPVAGAKRIALSHDRGGRATVMVRADREAAITIANNVIGNAIRYTPEGGEVIANVTSDGEFGIISVRDTGIGIPEHEQRRVFERFYRTEQSRQHSSVGTGLGLAIVKNLTQSQGGQVRLWSQPGEGSKFDILLPLQSANRSARQLAAAREAKP
jgi:two-component system phosphate regulon sensor histidine kinase PhoR